MALTAFTFTAIGLVAGWFLHTSMTGEARATVTADMQIVEQVAKKAEAKQ